MGGNSEPKPISLKVKCIKCGYVFYIDEPPKWICLKCGAIYETEKKRDNCVCGGTNIIEKNNSDYTQKFL